LCIDPVVLPVRSDEPDIDDAIRIIDPHHDAILVAGDVEYSAAVVENARAADFTSAGVAQSAPLTCRYQAINGSRASACAGLRLMKALSVLS
jgi:hypothetical protein